MEGYFFGLCALVLLYSAWVEYRAGKRVDEAMKLLASRSYVEFAKGEDILARKGKAAAEKKSVGDGYTVVFE